VGSRDGDDRYQAGDPAGAGRSQSGDGESDLIEIGGHPRLWPWLGARGTTAGIALAALAVGLLLGFAAGRHTGGAKARPAPRTTEKTAVAVPLIGDAGIIFTGNRCAVQHGRTLQLGIEIDNRAAKLYDVLAQNATHAVAAAQLAAIIKVAEVLYEDGRATVMTRRLVNMQRTSAPA